VPAARLMYFYAFSESIRVAQLTEVLPGIAVPDVGVGEVFAPYRGFRPPEDVSNRNVVAKIKLCTELLLSGAKDRHDIV
jgi:hypothetical protein